MISIASQNCRRIASPLQTWSGGRPFSAPAIKPQAVLPEQGNVAEVSGDLANLSVTTATPFVEARTAGNQEAPAKSVNVYQSPAGLNGPLSHLDETNEGSWNGIPLSPPLDHSAPPTVAHGTSTSKPADVSLLDGILSRVLDAGVYSAKALLSGLGVLPNQRTGKSYDAALSGAAKTTQNIEWKAGQVAALLEYGRGDWAQEVANGGYSELAGQSLFDKLEGFQNGDHEFGHRMMDSKWKLTERNTRFPSELDGREVAFRASDESGEVREYHGVLQAGDGMGTALFKLKGSDAAFNSNFIRELAYRPNGFLGVGRGEPYGPQPESTPAC